MGKFLTEINKVWFLVGISIFWLSGIMIGWGLAHFPNPFMGWEELERTTLALAIGAALFIIGLSILSSSISEEQKRS